MPKTLNFGTQDVTQAASTTTYLVVGSGYNSGTVTTEANAQLTWRTAGTFSSMSLEVLTNGTTANSTFQFRKNTANGNQAITIGSGATGAFADSVNTDAVAAGDIVDYSLITGVGGSLRFVSYSCLFDATTTNLMVNKLIATGAQSDASASATVFQQYGGQLALASTEINAQFINSVPATINNLYVHVSANARASSGTTVKSRKNTADGNLSLSIGALATGVFEDTANSDSVVAGDLINSATVTGLGTGTVTIDTIGVDYQTTNNATAYIAGTNAAGGSFAANNTFFIGVTGSFQRSSESGRRVKANASVFLSNLQCYITANTITATSTLGVQKTGVTGNLIVSIGSSATGAFADNTHADSVLASDYISYKHVAGATGTSMTIGYVGITSTRIDDPWFPIYEAQVIAPPAAAKFSTVVQKVLPTPISQNNFYPTYEQQVKAAPPRTLFSTTNAQLLPAPISINKFYPAYEQQVKVASARAQFSTTVAQLLPSPITRRDFDAIYDSTVKAAPPRALFSTIAQLLPIPVTRRDFDAIYDSTVKPASPRAQFSTANVQLLLAPISINRFYPVYEQQVKAAAPRAQFSYFSQTLASPVTVNKFYPIYDAQVKPPPQNNISVVAPMPTPSIPVVFNTINWFPAYAAEVKATPAAAQFSSTAQLLPAPIALNNWYPQYPDNVNAAPSAAQFGMVVNQEPIIFAPVPPAPISSPQEIYGAPHFKKRKRWFDRPQKDILPELDWFEDQQKKKAEFNDFIRDILDPPPQVEQEPEQIITDAASAVSAAKKEEPDNHEIELLLLLGL